MGAVGGPDIERNGLIFGMDTGYGVADNNTATRFYSGKPTENLLALAGADTDLERSGDGSGYSYHGVNITSYVQSRWSSSNNKLVQSFEGKRDYSQGGTGGGGDGYPRMYVYFTDWSWSSSFGITSYDWSYNKQIFTMPNPAGKSIYMNIYHMNNGNPGRSYSRNHSVSFNTNDTPYVSGTRSSTQSLIDLTKTSNIDVSNVSFDSTGQPTFDGTDDNINLGYAPISGTGDFTISSTYKVNTSAANTIIGNYPNSSLQFMGGYGLYINGSCYFTSTPLSPGTYYATATRENGVCKIYLNGQLQRTTNNSNSIGTNSFKIGTNTSGTEPFNGEVYNIKVYNRALSADEIQQNYNAYKNRFNL